MLLPIRFIPDPVLRTKCEPVNDINDDILEMLDNMLESMYANNGGGLAANQVGYNLRLVVSDPGNKETPQPIKFINPIITWRSEELEIQQEGCLSLPGVYLEISRSAEVKVQYCDTDGNTKEMNCQGYLAACVQHEIDHLDGVLFTDHVSDFKRKLAFKKARKNIKILSRKRS